MENVAMENTDDELALSDYQALAEMRYHIRRFLRFSEQAARSVGLEPQQHQLLLALKGLPAELKATVGELAERLQIQPHSTVELINRMIERDLIKRSRAPNDQRQVIVQLTPHGEEVLRQLSLLHRAELQSAAPALIQMLQTFVAQSSVSSKASGVEANEKKS